MTPQEIIVQIDRMKRSLDFDTNRFCYRVSIQEWESLEKYLNDLEPITTARQMARERATRMQILGVTIVKNVPSPAHKDQSD
jgi:hypothetical protein